MNFKETLLNRIRGWFPQEPKMSRHANQVHLPFKIKPLPKYVKNFAGLLGINIVVLSVLFAYSTLQIALTASLALFALFWFITNRTRHINAGLYFKRTAVLLTAFVLVFSCFQFFVLTTSGYPTTSTPTLTYPAVTKASLTQYLQDVEHSENFRLIQVNHVNSTSFEGLEIHSTTDNGWLTWTFRTSDTNSKVTIGNTQNSPYYTSVDTLMESIITRTQPTQAYTLQETDEVFKQIDAVGLNGFLTRAIDSHPNKTSIAGQISALNIFIGYDDVGGYQGLTVTLSARSLSQDSRGQTVYPGLFEAEFKPDGTLLSLKAAGDM